MEDKLLQQLQQQYSTRELISLSGGYNNPVYLLRPDDALPIVLKFVADDSIEYEVMSVLDHKMIPVVRNKLHVNGKDYFSMDYLPGERLYELLSGSAFSQQTPNLISEIADFLIWKRQLKITNYGFLSKAKQFELSRPAFDYLSDSEMDQLESYIAPGLVVNRYHVTHGDFTTKNIMIGKDSIHIFDWESARLDSDYRDLATFIWYCSLHHSESFADIYREIQNRYNQVGIEIDKQLLLANAFIHIAGVVQNSYQKDVATYENWKQRIRIGFRWAQQFADAQ